MKFRFLDNVAIADIAFEAFGKNEEECFENAALALFEIMADTKKIKPKKKLAVALKAETLDRLLYDWLSELVYLKDTKQMAFSDFNITITKPNNKQKQFSLKAQIFGEKIDYKKNKDIFRLDVKAITKHLFLFEKRGKQFVARVVPDI